MAKMKLLLVRSKAGFLVKSFAKYIASDEVDLIEVDPNINAINAFFHQIHVPAKK